MLPETPLGSGSSMRVIWNRILPWSILPFLLLHATPSRTREPGGSPVQTVHAFIAMGCHARCILYGGSRGQNERAFEDLFNLLNRIEKVASFYDPGSEINRIPRGVPAPVSRELGEMLLISQRYHRETGGAFDITLGTVKALWDRYRHLQKKPTDSEIEKAVSATGMDKLELSGSSLTILDPALRLDLSGMAKGYAVDAGVALLQSAGIQGGLLNIGGDLRVFGARKLPSQRQWKIAVQDPRPGKGAWGSLWVEDMAVATSGNYRRFVEAEDHRLGHIFRPGGSPFDQDPRLLSVTIVCPACTDADVLATTVFVMGLDRGLHYLRGKTVGYLLLAERGGKLETYANVAFEKTPPHGPPPAHHPPTHP